MNTLFVLTTLLDRQVKAQAAAHRAARRTRRAAAQERERRRRMAAHTSQSTPRIDARAIDAVVSVLRNEIWRHDYSFRQRLRDEAYADLIAPRANVDLALAKLDLASCVGRFEDGTTDVLERVAVLSLSA